MEDRIQNAASKGLEWLKRQSPATVKDLSRSVQALSLWNEQVSSLVGKLLSLKKDGFWDTETPLVDTARASIALSGCKKMQPGMIEWIKEQQRSGNWSNNEIDTAYALIALGTYRIKNEKGCEWLVRNYGKKWEHPGTTALNITALIKQNRNKYEDFIVERSAWLLSKRGDGGWKHIATSNLVIQALILAGITQQDIEQSVIWLLERQKEDGCWKDITSTSLSLVSIKMYLDRLNSISNNKQAGKIR